MNMSFKNVNNARRAAAGAALIPLAAAAVVATTSIPAEASTSRSGCTVTPLPPIYAGYHNSAAVKMIRYRLTVTCAANRTAVMEWQGVEEDWSLGWPHKKNPDDGDWSRTVRVSFGSASTRTLIYDNDLPDTESGYEEMYHKVRFRVISNGVESAFTAWERTPYVSFIN
jgi:hypothetical protein